MEKTPINEKSEPPQSSASETEVTGDVPSSNSRKGKRQLDSGIDLQPVPKKCYNLRSRKSNFSEEEVSAKVPTTNRRTGKRLAESDPDLQASSKKPHNPRNKIFSISDDEDSQEEKESIYNEVEDLKETKKMNAKVSVGENMGDVGSLELKQCINKGIEDMKQTGEVNKTIATEEAKRYLGCQKEDSMGDKVEKVRETLDMSTSAPVEKVEEELVSREGKESINEDIEERNEIAQVNRTISIVKAKGDVGCQKEDGMDEKAESVSETLDMSSEHVEKIEEELGSQKGKESINEDIDDVKETVEVNTTIATKEAMEDLGSQEGRESINEDIDDVKETVEVKTTISIEEAREDLEGKESINEDIEMKENVEVNTTMAVQETVELNATIDVEVVRGYLGEEVSEKETEDTVDSWELSSRCTVDSQEETEDEVVYAKENAEAKDEQSSLPVVPKTSLPTRSKIVFVGNLPYSIRRNSVVKFFEDVGSVVDIRMPKNADGSTKGFCHVTFATYAAALKALEKNGEMLCNRSVKLDLAEDLRNRHMLERTVLVRGLQRNQRENDIRKSLLKHFEDCGGIKKVHVPKDIQSGDSTRVAFIQFEDSEAVPKAVELCGSELSNCKLFVKEVSRSRFRR